MGEWKPVTPENIASLVEQILVLESQGRRKLIASVENPALLEFVAIEVLERAKDAHLTPYAAFVIDDELVNRIEHLRGHPISPRREKRRKMERSCF